MTDEPIVEVARKIASGGAFTDQDAVRVAQVVVGLGRIEERYAGGYWYVTPKGERVHVPTFEAARNLQRDTEGAHRDVRG